MFLKLLAPLALLLGTIGGAASAPKADCCGPNEECCNPPQACCAAVDSRAQTADCCAAGEECCTSGGCPHCAR